MQLTYLDSNSWLIELDSKRILLDPWLVGPLVFGNLPWLFKGERPTSRSIPQNIDTILLSQGLEDHAHPPTLERLDRDIPVVASLNAAKVVRELGYTEVTVLAHQEKYNLDGKVEIEAVPGSPIGPFLTENGYLIKGLESGNVIYYEPHGYHSATIKKAAPVDVVIAPIIDINIPFLGPVIKGQKSALEVCQWLQPQVILPTAFGGDVRFDGWLTSVLNYEGSIEKFRSLLERSELATRVISPQPGEAFSLDLEKRTASSR